MEDLDITVALAVGCAVRWKVALFRELSWRQRDRRQVRLGRADWDVQCGRAADVSQASQTAHLKQPLYLPKFPPVPPGTNVTDTLSF